MQKNRKNSWTGENWKHILPTTACISPKLLEFTGQNSSKCTLVKHSLIYYKFYTYTQIHINSGEIPDAQTSKNSIREKLEAYSPNHCTSPKPLGWGYENSCMYTINRWWIKLNLSNNKTIPSTVQNGPASREE